MNKTTKFDELRFKTDNQLIRLVNHELDCGICYALEALRHLDDSAAATQRYSAAQRACTKSHRLLRLAGEIPANERSGLESKLAHLRGLLALVRLRGDVPQDAPCAKPIVFGQAFGIGSVRWLKRDLTIP